VGGGKATGAKYEAGAETCGESKEPSKEGGGNKIPHGLNWSGEGGDKTGNHKGSRDTIVYLKKRVGLEREDPSKERMKKDRKKKRKGEEVGEEEKGAELRE